MKFLILPLFLLLSNGAFAQTYAVQNIVELTNDLTARINAVKDKDGNICALIRVNIPSVNDIKFISPIIGKPVFLPGEYNVYLSKNSSALSFIVDGQTYNIFFSDFNISLEEKKCYRVILSKAPSNNSPKTNTRIIANYDNVVVMIDGLPVGQTPLTLDNITPGKHVISVPNTIGVTMNDTTVKIKEKSTIILSLHKEKRKAVLVDMATPGGDTAGWYKVFGTNRKREKGKQGIVDYAGNIIVPCEFDNVYPSILNGYYEVTNNGKIGLYEPEKGLAIPCIYDNICYEVTDNGEIGKYEHVSYMTMCIDGKWGVMSPSGQVIVPVEYDRRPHCYKDAISVTYKKPGYKEVSGLLSYDGKEIIGPKYEYLYDFVNGYALFKKYDGSLGFVDKNGKETILPSCYSFGEDLNIGGILMNGLFRVKDRESGKWGYMDTNLNLVIPAIYDVEPLSDFYHSITKLKLNNKDVIINNKGKTILDCNNSNYKKLYVTDFNEYENRYSYKNHFLGYYGTDGKDDNTFIDVKNNDDLWGLLDVNGNVVVPCRYDNSIKGFTEEGKDYFMLPEQDQLLVTDLKQNILFSIPSNLIISEIRDGFIMVRDEETESYGYLNTKGEVLANCIYGYDGSDETDDRNLEYSRGDYDITGIINERPISEGLAILNIGDRFGFIDNKGVIKVPLIYTAVTPFENGISYVRQMNGKWKRIYKKDL